MNDELMNIDQLDFDEEEFQEQPQTAEEEIFGAQSNFTKDWMGGDYHSDNNSDDNQPDEVDSNDSNSEVSDDIISCLLKERGIKDEEEY